MTTLFKFKDDGVFFEQMRFGQACRGKSTKATDDCIAQIQSRYSQAETRLIFYGAQVDTNFGVWLNFPRLI